MALDIPRSPAGWYTAILSVVVILVRIAAIYNPKSTMKQFGINDAGLAKVFSFFVIVVNGFTLTAALQDNWAMYCWDLTTRVVASVWFYALGGGWKDLAVVELGSAVVLAVCMAYS